ncbi:MAG: helix-turn-helix transcriptional regulator [Ktedonobacteraceae bacterium]
MASHVSKQNGETLQPLLLNVPQVMKLLGLSCSKVYKLIRLEGLPVVRFGRSVRVSPISLQQWLVEREQQQVA